MPPRRNTRERLIDAAVDIIDERGAGRLRLRQVAEAVGIREPSIYKFFANKDALVVAASVRRYQRGLLDLTAAFGQAVGAATSRDDFRAAVRQAIRAAYAPERDHYRSARFSVVGMAQSRADLAEQLLAAQHEADVLLGEAFAVAARKGWVRTDIDPVVLAGWALSIVNARILLQLDPERRAAEDWDRLTTETILWTLEGVDTTGVTIEGPDGR
jgi:AcrR family transcriptional regulator